ncbi:sensor histidine kinase [Kitasatospora sp. NPDC052896]|uniref:sensor histidine kinase n=1 Tax=Kitasatospora sp. NPDC052896 TaxID=3364061 RepID=UPI0037CBE843
MHRQPSPGSGLQRARSFLILATGLYRASHLTGGLLAVAEHERSRPGAWTVLGAAVVCSVLVHGRALRDGALDERLVWLDVLVSGCLLPFAAVGWSSAGATPTQAAWVLLLGGSAGATAAVAGSGRRALGAVLLLAAVHLCWHQLVHSGPAVLAGDLNALASSAVLARVFWWYLRRQGRLLDAATRRALAAEAERARYAERLDHHRALHDTVLATLTVIAAGGVDANTAPVRERCARDAAYLRRLIQRGTEPGGRPEIGAALEQVVRSVEELGLTVTAQYRALPELPGEVAAALAAASGEALTNVLRHAGTRRAHLTATGTADGIRITVADQGTGFDPARTHPGFGLRRSVHARLREAGGRAAVDSAPGEGTCVELRWPA